MSGRQFPDDTLERIAPLRESESVATSSQTANEVLDQIEELSRQVMA